MRTSCGCARLRVTSDQCAEEWEPCVNEARADVTLRSNPVLRADDGVERGTGRACTFAVECGDGAVRLVLR